MKPETIQALMEWIDMMTAKTILASRSGAIPLMTLNCKLQDLLIKEKNLCQSSKPNPPLK